MDSDLTTLKWNVDLHDDTYYEVHLYRYFGQQNKRKLSTIKVVGRGHEVERRALTEVEVAALIRAIGKITIKFDESSELVHTLPRDDYRLRIKNPNFNLDFKWTSDGIYGNHALSLSLMDIVERLRDIKDLDYSQLGLEPKE